ncbi:MAG TPA: amino acid adenylation domain-containing protein, partial [Thermoanaerobaculia bacterium]|nr:amino acid adenylation domain-containing protein [Thermoanaerobaculia bacterium]
MAPDRPPERPADHPPADSEPVPGGLDATARRTLLAQLLADRARQSCSLPLSAAQHRLWWLDQLHPGSAAYNVNRRVRLEGTLDAAALGRALAALTQRHQALRTHFMIAGDEPVQAVAPAVALPLPEIDLQGLSGARAACQAEALAAALARRPFALTRPPLLRATLLRRAPGEAVLLLTVHHIVADGWSLDLLLRELAALYEAQAAGRPCPLAPPLAQYADFVAWQRREQAGERLAEEIAHWRRRLAGAPTRLELPADRPEPAVPSGRGALARFELAALPAGLLRERARAWRTTPFVCLLAGTAALLQRLTGATDLLLLTPMTNRPRAAWAGLCGMCVETLVLRLDLAGDPDFATLAARARGTVREALAHPLPFDRLVAELQPERRADRNPLSPVMLLLDEPPPPPLVLSGLRLTPRPLHTGTAKFDLLLALQDLPAEVAGDCEYAADRFDGVTVKRLLAQLATLLAAAAAEPGRRLAELPLLGAAERHQLLYEWNPARETAGIGGRPGDCVVDFERQAALTPHAAAVELGGEPAGGPAGEPGGRWTYAELDAHANRLAHHLLARGVAADEVVAICAERSPEMLAAVLAVLKAGAAYLALDPSYPAARQRFVLEDSRVAWILTQERQLHRLAGLPPPPLGSREVLCLDGPAGLLAAAAAPVRRLPSGGRRTAASAPRARPGELAYVVYTSGTTGQPKGIAMTRRALANLLAWQEASSPLRGPVRTLQFASLAFDVSFQEIFSTWRTGGTLVLVSEEERRDPAALLALIEAKGIERLFVPYVALRQLAEEAMARGAAPPRLREIVTAGEQLVVTPAIAGWLARLPHCRLDNQYGPAETHVVTCQPLRGAPAAWPALPSIGRPVTGCRIRLLDAGGEPVPIGVTGEIHIGGQQDVCLARGYAGRPALTAARFVPDPLAPPAEAGRRLYRTGDLARYRHDGTIDFIGRADHQVKMRGWRVEPGEIEATLAGHPAIAAAAVAALRDGGGEQRLVAWLAAAPGVAAPPAAELRAWLAERLPEPMVPSRFVPVPALPMAAGGKLDRGALLARLTALPALAATPEPALGAAPRGEIEGLLARIWGELLQRRPVGRHDHFFRLGGHSLLAARATSRIRRLLGVDLPVRALFEAPTPAGLAVRIAGLQGSGAAARPEVTRQASRGPAPLSFAQQRLWFLDRLTPGSAHYHLGWALHLAGPLDRSALARALAGLIARHEALRTRFVEVDGTPLQVVSPPGAMPLPRIDLGALGRAAEGVAVRLGSEWLRRPFDLERGLLARFALLRLDGTGGQHALLCALHHLAADGWSLELLAGELGTLYRAAAAGRSSPLPEPALQALDFATWQRRWLRGEVLAGLLAHWRRRLAGCPPSLELPTDRPRPPLPSYRGRNHRARWPAPLVAELQRLAGRQEVTLFMVGLAAFAALLGRLGGQVDLAIGSAVANRHQEELEGTVGLLANTVVLRCDLAGEPSLLELLPRVRETTLQAVAHQDLPFERLVEELQPERDLARTPLFQVVFDLQPTALFGGLDLGDVAFRALPVASGTAKFDLTLSLEQGGEVVDGLLQSSSDLFDGAAGERLLAQLATLLAAAVAAPGRRLGELPLLGPGERHQLLVELSGAASAPSPPPPGGGLAERIAAQGRARPDAVAICGHRGGGGGGGDRGGGESLTYGELWRRAATLARRLRRLGVGPEVTVAVALDRSPELVVALLAVVAAGGAYVPLDPTHPAERLRAAVADSRAAALVIRGAALAGLAGAGTAVLDLARAETAPAPADAAGGLAPRPIAAAPGGLAYVIFTSGSTGRPKGVAIAESSLLWLLAAAGERIAAGPADVWTLCHSCAFDFSVWEMWGALLHGGRLVVVPREVALSP